MATGAVSCAVVHRALTNVICPATPPPPPELYVWEDDIARTIRFTNARSDGFMSKFDGTWHVQPFTQQTLDSIYKGGAAADQEPRQEKGHNWLGSELGFVDRGGWQVAGMRTARHVVCLVGCVCVCGKTRVVSSVCVCGGGGVSDCAARSYLG